MQKKSVLIIGAGTAGIVIANKLQDSFDVTVVERSSLKKYPMLFSIPLLIGILFRKNNKYITARKFLLSTGREIPFFESQLLGGASVINGCVHTVGMQSIWEAILSNFDSNYHELMESYSELFSSDPTSSDRISLRLAHQTKLDNAFINALNNMGIVSGDMNYANDENCGPIYNTVGKFFRASVLSLMKRKKFKLYLGEKVKSLLIDNDKRVFGAITDKKVIYADYVILSAGVLGTNSLLLSETRDKKNAEISGYEIGKNIQDHLNLRINIFTKDVIGSLNEIDKSNFKKFKMLLSHFLGIPTLLTGTGATSGVHLDLDGDGIVDTRIQVVQFSESGRHGSDGKYFDSQAGFSLSITPISPYSKGEIFEKDGLLNVMPKYLCDDRDYDNLVAALKFCIRLLRSEPLSHYVEEIQNLDMIEERPRQYIENYYYSGHHLIGGAGVAIRPNFELKFLNNIYVCDASILKNYPASNIHSSVALISNIFSKKFILNNVQV